ncbi:hypothetical protein, partial [Klebsiella pneumoniae]|uniref:hypothetical protein n=1 Tax=Klebsiella pneumoniae TaxID=573 RepID=UPI002730A1A5
SMADKVALIDSLCAKARILPVITIAREQDILPLADALAAWRVQAPAPIDLSGRPLGRDLLYSSGTTGRPKGIKKALPAALYRTQADPEFLAWQR